MTKSIYDPTAVISDAFSMGNFSETATAKVLTDIERTAIGAALSKTVTSDQAMASNVDFDAGKGVSYDGVDYLPEQGTLTVTSESQHSGTNNLIDYVLA